MGLFNRNNNAATQLSPRQILENKYSSSCGNLLLVVVFTAINIVLLVANSNTYFLFSAYIPYLLADLGMYFCGLYPAEVYGGSTVGMDFLSKSFLVVMLGIAAVILVLYLLSWLFSRKQKPGWLIFALVIFGIDTVAMLVLNGFAVDSIVDYLFHGWVIYSLISGISAYSKLKKLPEEPEQLFEEPVQDSVAE